MNKQKYMEELNIKLTVFGEEIKNEIVSDYEEHFRMGLANGKTEEQICRELGNIDELVDELNKLTGRQESSKDSSDTAGQFAKDMGEAMSNFAGFLGGLAATIAKNSEKFASNFSEAAGSAANKATEKATDWSEKAADWGEKFSTKAGDWTVEFKAKAGETAENFMAKAGQAAETLKAKAGETAETLKAKAEEMKDSWNAGKQGSSFSGTASETEGGTESPFRCGNGEKIGEFAEKSGEYARKAAENIGAFAKDFASKTKAFAKEVGQNYRQAMNREAGEAAADTDLEDEIDELAREIARDEADTLREMDSLDGAYEDSEPAQDAVYHRLHEENGEESTAAAGIGSRTGSSAEDADSVIIETDCGDVTVNGCAEDEKIKFRYENNGSINQKLAYGFDFRQEGRTIYVVAKKKPGTTNFFKSITSPDIELTIEVPEGMKNLSIRTMSGDVHCEDVAVEQLTAATVSGDIAFENCIVKALEANTMSGDIQLEDSSASSMSISTVSGDIDTNETGAQSLNTKTTSGDITLEECRTLDLNASSISGDIEVTLTDVGGYLAHVKTTCGDISLEFNDESVDVIRGGSYVLGNGEVKLNISTVSGDIEVEA